MRSKQYIQTLLGMTLCVLLAAGCKKQPKPSSSKAGGARNAQAGKQGGSKATPPSRPPAAGAGAVCKRWDVKGCEKECQRKNGESCDRLGQVQERNKNAKAAVAAYRASCALEYMAGCSNLGTMLMDGDGVGKDLKKAAELFARACAGKRAPACYNLGLLHERGRGMPKNPTKAAAFYRKACSGGYAKACMNLGVILSKQGPSGKVESTKHYRRACALGDALGCGALGNAYVLGWGVAKDIAEGQRWLTKACKQHNSWACSRLRQVAGAAKR